ncbi:hypothetical protein K450DRAFT_242555 [Umbelopsis ramanniana AG]|uniref:3'-5' exonuclease domain-containing protein n=1 Tax=Umbelopsis ramanniana AG TaxID=1314678 RepID=A0AAD5HDT0_UMBRA|nr:uncharacterized protein K450DRAFT_242555 [Umbelopsis ramanniana AG]KAI8579299.1 hypothetical protein K450DRAFT_242555 [Umbelopsis ramanniana AG]
MSRSGSMHVPQKVLWSTAMTSCQATLSLLTLYEKEDYALVNSALHSLRQLVGLGSNFEHMKAVQKTHQPTTEKKKPREMKDRTFEPNENWHIVDRSEIHIPIGGSDFITAKVVDTAARLEAIIPILNNAKKIALDCEFLGEKNKTPEVKCIQVAPSDRIGYNILVDRIGVDIVRDLLGRILTSPKVHRIGWAFNTDASAMERLFDVTMGGALDLQAKLRDIEGETMNLGSAVHKYAKSWAGYQRFLEAKSLAASFHFTGKDCVWLQYPLAPAALVYSVFDVVSLFALDEATTLHLTLESHFWPRCTMLNQKGKGNKGSKSTSSAVAVVDSMEEFEFDPQDKEFLDFPREKPPSSSQEDVNYIDDLNLAVQLSLREAEKAKTTANKLNEVAPTVGDHDTKRKNKMTHEERKNISKAVNRKGQSKADAKFSTRQTQKEIVDKKEEEDDHGTVTHYNLSSSSDTTTKDAATWDTDSKKDDMLEDMQGLNEEEEIEMWKGFAMQQWKRGEDVTVDDTSRASQWQSPAPRSSPKDSKQLAGESRPPHVAGSPRLSTNKREKFQNDTKKRQKPQSNGSRDEVSSSGESTDRVTPAKARSPVINMHPVLLQKSQALSEDNYESDMPLDDDSLLHLHTINSPERLKNLKFANANKALTSTVAILGHFQQTSSRKKKLHAIQLLTESDDVYTILLDSAVPNPNDLQGSLLEYVLTASTIRRVSWEFEELANHIERRLMIRPGRTLCLKPRMVALNPNITLQNAVNFLLGPWKQKDLYDILHGEKANLKGGKFVDYWAKDLPPYQIIKAGVIECKAIEDMSRVDMFSDGKICDSDFWDGMSK